MNALETAVPAIATFAMTATDHEVRFGPDDLTADLKAGDFQALIDKDRLGPACQTYAARSGKQFPRRPPIRTIVILRTLPVEQFASPNAALRHSGV
jgi:hypothetical protein